MIVVADTSPLNYLVLIDEIEILPQLFGNLLVPNAVWNELSTDGAPRQVKDWIKTNPEWVDYQITNDLGFDDQIRNRGSRGDFPG